MYASRSFGRKHGEGSSTPPSNICEGPATKSNQESLKRRKVKQALFVFRKLYTELLGEYDAERVAHPSARSKALMEAAMLMKTNHQWENTVKRVGHVEGIETGDQFQYRAELNVIGLHRQFTAGIDYMGQGGNSLATSIVATDRYANTRTSSSHSLVYIGQGGNPCFKSSVVPRDQKLEAGNLALKNSMDARSPVRVILKPGGSFVYNGLYLVDKMTQERGEFGKLVFKFTLNRVLAQPATRVALKDVVMENVNSKWSSSFALKKRHKSEGCAAQKHVILVNDISKGQEKFPIRVVTSVDSVQTPPSFDYIINNMYSKKFKQSMLCGCDCVDGCVDWAKCACIRKNGGEMPYDCNKRLSNSSMKSSLIYECGPYCKCSSSCTNRVSQCGIQFQVEIFRTDSKGWGVRTRSFIPSGSFVCEYVGEVHHERAAGSKQNVDDYIVNMGVGNGYVDATGRGNVARFINHSCSPNLEVRDVMYDHNYQSFPHQMFFAAKDIPAGRELSYDYNCCRKGRNIKVGSNSCYCGSRQCIRKIYI